jgi:hypothetical protein
MSNPTPCKSCPWRRDSRAGAIAGPEGPGLVPGQGDTWEGMIAQAHGPFWLPCHSCMDDARGKDQDPAAVTPCIGAGIYRTHINRDPRMANDLTPHYPANKELVFASPIEFLMHHAGMTREEATRQSNPFIMAYRVGKEIARAQSKLMAVDRTTGEILDAEQLKARLKSI